MGLFDWVRGLLGFGNPAPNPVESPVETKNAPLPTPASGVASPPSGPASSRRDRGVTRSREFRRSRSAIQLRTLRFQLRPRSDLRTTVQDRAHYRFARPSVEGGFLDLTQSGDTGNLEQLSLPVFRTPEEIAGWLQIPLGQLAWLVHRFDEDQKAGDEKTSHYWYRLIPKRSGGQRLIEAPKAKLKRAQWQILDGILSKVPAHRAAHGFVASRSILTNATPHVGQRVIVKLDLENFYPSVTFNRVVAIFRSLGYCREAAIWLGRLTTTTLPRRISPELSRCADLNDYRGRRLPQGAPTSPALANLSAFALDLRLSGLARSFHANYSRYADDITFSGDDRFLRSLAVFIPLVKTILKSERFRANRRKWRVIRNNQRQTVTGVVVNARPNVTRRNYDRLKAILTNCIRRGASTQNHSQHKQFAAHLLGRIAQVSHLNAERGQKLYALYS
ncbi:MAG: RNA-directed DNA polymerase, partial [Planctomycetes bacterium]|nr:RNA-directed DNA polymerase [Planctomycetota bacterium]